MSDNATAISYINHMGGTKSARCNDIARVIWNWVLWKGIWITANHIPGKENTEADQMSRTFTDHTEWILSDEIFKKICDIWGTPDIDLFTNRLNHKVTEYASCKPDPESCFINAFSKNWEQFAYTYCFLLFSSIWKALSKIRKESSLLIAPLWSTESWFQMILQNVIKAPIIFNSQHLQLPGTNNKHQLYPKLKLVAFLLWNNTSEHKTYLTQQRELFWPHEEQQLKS